MNFNAEGFFEPFTAIETELASAKDILVWNEARNEIWDNFEIFLRELQGILQSSFTIWLNGSFATKKEIPNDLDLVVFIDFQEYLANEKDLAKFKTLSYRKIQKLDAYFVKVYPEIHERKLFEEFDTKEWFSLFTKTRNKEKKGFLELKF